MATATLVFFDSPDLQARLVYDDAVSTGASDAWNRQYRIFSVTIQGKTNRRCNANLSLIGGTLISRVSTSTGSITVNFPGTRFMTTASWEFNFG